VPDPAADGTAREVVVHGRVQGVFFRDSCRREAQDAGVAGWVSNEPDGTVRAHFEGAAGDVERLVAWTREGPSSADVDRVDVTEVEPHRLSGFDVR
jgi:acylphosphatase